MACLSCNSVTKAFVYGSLRFRSSKSNDSNNSTSSQPNSDPKHSNPLEKPKPKATITLPLNQTQRQSKLYQQLALSQLEHAIGAGSYRDSEHRGSRKRKSKELSQNSRGPMEGSIEKKLEETGDWLVNKTEEQIRSTGKGFLMFTFQWILPTYILLFLMASGVIKVPLESPLLDDLIM
ncbi:hypothetical protein K2173_022032 [Erythroxylum novogranatense]|uniref:Chlororespiratory reduction 3 n=1 Tax=Erythroxylum novogranatense TaxID=1862640 RepID=A0AAV8T4D4_9ROSI|nr:hypothetical protein K2173_022032 [Erythroxylum novogranatense]